MLTGHGRRLVILFLGTAFGLETSASIEQVSGGIPQPEIDSAILSSPGEDVAAGQSGIAYSARDPAGEVSRGSEESFWVFLPALSRNYNPNRLTYSPSNDTHPALSPNRETILFVSDREGRAGISRVRIGNEPATNLSQTDAAEEDTPVFSPDGSQLAFASNRSGDWDLYVVEPDGTDVRPAVSNRSSDELHSSFTHDSQGLVSSSNREAGNWGIYTATIGSDQFWARLTSHPADDRFPTVSERGLRSRCGATEMGTARST